MSFLRLAASRRHPELPLGQGAPQDTLAQKFEAYDKEYPYIYIAIRNRAFYLATQGARYLSMKGIFESLRGTIGGGVKLNNSYTSCYTDKLIADCPTLAPYFHRRARAKKAMRLVYAK